jgi:L-ascorbate metabolism protein UlaG (beta-lactamase superfamily)
MPSFNNGTITTNHHSSSTLAPAAAGAAAHHLLTHRNTVANKTAPAFASANRPWMCHQPFSSSHLLYARSKRFYFYIPTSWTELKLRMRDKGETQARMVKVKLHQFWNKHYGAANTSQARVATGDKIQASSVAANYRARIKASVAANRARIKASVAANRKHGREWLEKQQQQWLVLRNHFKGRRRRFFRKRFKEPLLQWVQQQRRPWSIYSSSSSSSRHIDLSLIRRGRGQWLALPESDGDSRATITASPRRRFVVKVREYSETSWFDAASGRPLVSRDETGRFVNPWLSQSSDGVHPISSIIKWRQIRLAREWSAWQNNFMQRFIRPILNYFTNSLLKSSSSSAHIIADTTEQVETAGGDTTKDTTKPTDFTRQGQEQVQQLSEGTLRFTWIGHATCLLQQGDISILTDPIFSAHASPLPPLLAPFMGVARHVPPLRVSSQQQGRRYDMNGNDTKNIDDNTDDDGKTVILPDKIDVCLISHDHYDHLDLPSVHQLADRVGCWVVPIGIGEFLQRHACIPAHRIVELEWWESAKLVRKPFTMDKNSNNNDEADSEDNLCERHQHDWSCVQIHSLHKRNEGSSEQEPTSAPFRSITSNHHHHPARLDPANTNQLWITATPVQHWASRTMLDRNYRLWAGFCVFLDQQQTFFFAGDTAFPQEFPLFEQVADYIASAKMNITTNIANSNAGDNDDNDDDENKTIVDLAALPIGAYKPRFLNHTSHMEPKDALRVHQLLQCRQSVAIHHGTFCLSEEPPDEPPRLLREAILEASAGGEQRQQQHEGIGSSTAAASSLNFVAIPHGGRIIVEPVSSSASSIVVDDDDEAGAVREGEGRRIGKDGKDDSDEYREEKNVDDADDDDCNNQVSASG